MLAIKSNTVKTFTQRTQLFKETAASCLLNYAPCFWIDISRTSNTFRQQKVIYKTKWMSMLLDSIKIGLQKNPDVSSENNHFFARSIDDHIF